MNRATRARAAAVAARLAAAVLDAAVVALAVVCAIMLRFDFREPPWGWRAVALSCVSVCAVHLAALTACDPRATSWRRFGTGDLPRLVAATTLAAAVLTAMRFFTPDLSFAHVRPPYSVTVLSFFLATTGLASVRLLARFARAGLRRESALLARDERHFDNAAAARFLAGKCVMVTGAGGSIGSELVRQVAAAGARRLLLVERCEYALYEIDRRMRGTGTRAELVPLLADVTDRARMAALFAAERPDVVLHAAAYKHVPLVEANPEAGWRNNVASTQLLAALACESGVSRFVLISTDKAVNPVSAMGRSKREAERAAMALNARGGTSFCAVRFGNVLGSSGSVVPLFREQIARGGPVTVTHPDMTRYFMTVGEAVSLVLQAASRRERAIYTLDMGRPVRILDLAEEMIARAGLRPYADVPIVFTGIRPGERLVEELDVSERSCYRTDMAKIYVTREGGPLNA